MVVAAQSWFSFHRDKVTATVKILAGAGHLWGWAISVSEKKKKRKRKRKEGRNKLLPRKKYVLNSMKTWHWCLLPKIGKLIYLVSPKTSKLPKNRKTLRIYQAKNRETWFEPNQCWTKNREAWFWLTKNKKTTKNGNLQDILDQKKGNMIWTKTMLD